MPAALEVLSILESKIPELKLDRNTVKAEIKTRYDERDTETQFTKVPKAQGVRNFGRPLVVISLSGESKLSFVRRKDSKRDPVLYLSMPAGSLLILLDDAYVIDDIDYENDGLLLLLTS